MKRRNFLAGIALLPLVIKGIDINNDKHLPGVGGEEFLQFTALPASSGQVLMMVGGIPKWVTL